MTFWTDVAANVARNHGLLVFDNDQQAVEHLRSRGYLAIKPAKPPAPPIGSRWQPQQGVGKHGAARQLRPRWVVGVGENDVFYALTQDGAAVAINRSSWERWVRKTRAEVVK